MPNYDYYCDGCGMSKEAIRKYEDRLREEPCPCGGSMHYMFPVKMTLWTFEPYHDESLGMDIRSRREKTQILKAIGFQEAGDKRGGARNFDGDANTGGILPLQGETYDDYAKDRELSSKLKEWDVYAQEGLTERKVSNTVIT